MNPGRELDALVAEKVMGLKVLPKRATAIFVEGEWSVHLGSAPEGWSCYAERAPVYAREGCDCAEPEPEREYKNAEHRATFAAFDAAHRAERAAQVAEYGHRNYCVRVVPNYSTEIAAAWEVVGRLSFPTDRRYFWVDVDPDGMWVATFGNHYTSPRVDTAPLAICLAALLAVGAASPPPGAPQ